MNNKPRSLSSFITLTAVAFLTAFVAGCARMGSPDGGWYDEEPPYVVHTSPDDKGVNVKGKKVQITFNEFIQIENATEKVVISPPQLEQADIKAAGKNIIVEIKDSLKENTTYTIDFSDAIADNNEGNPMGSYTYSFSTGDVIDTLEVSGYVLNAEDLEPMKGLLVGLTSTDSICGTMSRVSRTDSRGHFVIKGVAPGTYLCYALNDQDGNYQFSQRSEQLAYSRQEFSPSWKPDVRQDTLWQDSLHIRDIKSVNYTHFLPDDITLLAFSHEVKDRFFLKTERTNADRFTVFFSGPGSKVPDVHLMGNGTDADTTDMHDLFIIESTEKFDTITYWLRDTALVNQDTLNVKMTYEMTDSIGNMVIYDDTLSILAKTPYAKRMKQKADELEKWNKNVQKLRKKAAEGEVIDSIMPPPELKVNYKVEQSMAPNGKIKMTVPSPVSRFDSAAVHLYCMQDSSWFRVPFTLRKATFPSATDRDMEIIAEWLPDTEYSFEVDTLAFEDIYGITSKPYKTGFKIMPLDEFASLFVNITGIADTCDVIVQMLNSSDVVVMQSKVVGGTAEFYYITPGEYYMRAFVDSNSDGKWTTGDFYTDRLPEKVYYYPEKFECKAKWDITKNWDVMLRPIARQKPGAITKQRAEKDKKAIAGRNEKRAQQKGIPLPEYLKR